MSDLISRSELLESFRKSYCGHLGMENSNGMITFRSICRIINEQPTAYDINKVVKELEAIKGYACYGMNCDECKYTHDCFEGEKSEEMAIDKAIEIVKKSGISDDVCEWKSAIGGEFIQNPHTRILYINEPSMKNEYCNTCGKKIKVVE